jgi:hypothetical protein
MHLFLQFVLTKSFPRHGSYPGHLKCEHFSLTYLGNLRTLQPKAAHQALLIEKERIDIGL